MNKDYDHESRSTMSACGFTDEEQDQIKKTGSGVLKGTGNRSTLIERIESTDLTTRQKIFLAFSLGESLGEASKKPDIMEELMDVLK